MEIHIKIFKQRADDTYFLIGNIPVGTTAVLLVMTHYKFH